MKKTFLLLISTLLVFFCSASAQTTAPLSYTKGDQIQDFVFTTYSGQTYSLYDLLEEKDAIMLNLWASWCGPCKSEFPYMQEAYADYKDKIEIVALSTEPTDSPTKLSQFAQQYGLTFLIGQDSSGFFRALNMNSIPVTLMIDRFGTICFVQAGAQPDSDSFRRLFDVFIGDSYTESILLDAIPTVKPNVSPSDETSLRDALECNAKNPQNVYTWPMSVVQKDGRSVVASANANNASSRAEVRAELNAKAGDVVTITFKTSTEPIFDLMTIYLNGKTIKSFGGEHDWMTYSFPIESDGMQVVKVAYVKDNAYDVGKDTIWIDSIVLAANSNTALANNPVYPVSDTTSISVTSPSAREITIDDPHGMMHANFGNTRYYIVNSDKAALELTLSADIDPDKAFLFSSYDRACIPMSTIMRENAYAAESGVDSMDTTQYLCSSVAIYNDASGIDRTMCVLFRDERNLNSFINLNSLGSWSYIETNNNQSSAHSAMPQNSLSNYVFKCIDQDGKPVAGVMLQVCDEETCQVLISDANGICTFSAAPYAWEVHILKAPDGYSSSSPDPVIAPIEGGELVFTLKSK